MLKMPFLVRFLAGSVIAVAVTFGLTVLVMWMNGLIVEDKPSVVSYTPCVFAEQKSTAPKNPYVDAPLVVDCIPPEDAKPLFVQWFDRILMSRDGEESRTGAGRD